jgi:preprotein translocase subunit SecF
MIDIIGKRKYTYVFSGILLVLSLVFLSVWGLNLGIDFRGGTLMEVRFQESIPAEETEETTSFTPPTRQEIENKLSDLEIKSLSVQESEDNKAILKYISSDENLNREVLGKLKEFDGEIKQLRVDFIGSSVSNQLKKSAILALLTAVVGIALYIAWAFRKISFPIPSWQYGVGAILALAHDLIIVLGVFSALGKFLDVEIGIPFVAALLTILGYSVNDTIVVYDRVRENILSSDAKENFENITNKSLNETMARSINTSLTVIVVLLAIIIFGGATIEFFALTLLVGVVSGTYSSIFVASALLVSNYNYKLKKIN